MDTLLFHFRGPEAEAQGRQHANAKHHQHSGIPSRATFVESYELLGDSRQEDEIGSVVHFIFRIIRADELLLHGHTRAPHLQRPLVTVCTGLYHDCSAEQIRCETEKPLSSSRIPHDVVIKFQQPQSRNRCNRSWFPYQHVLLLGKKTDWMFPISKRAEGEIEKQIVPVLF